MANTADVLQTAIAALAGLMGGLASTAIAVRRQEAAERGQQRQRAAELFGPMGPLLTELNPHRIHINLPPAPADGPDPIVETLNVLEQRAHAVREQLSMLDIWWPTSDGSALARRLQAALLEVVHFNRGLVADARRNGRTGNAMAQAESAHELARLLMDQLRAEVRGQPSPARPSPRVGCAVLWHGPLVQPQK